MTRLVALFALVLMGVLAGTAPAAAQNRTPPAAADVVSAAVARARAERKAVLIEFGASWCTWCRNFEALVRSADAGAVLARHFVIVNLIVHEDEGKQALEHPGGNALMNEWGGATAGLPFYVFLGDTGRKVADSNAMPDGTNIGFPVTPEEVRAFLALIARSARMLSEAERDMLDRYLTRAAAPGA